MSFQSLGLKDQLIECATAAGFTEPTAIQTMAIPPALDGKDILGRVQAGAGKIEAYIFPMVQHLSRPDPENQEWNPPRALILTPTRKSTQDIQGAALRYGKHLSLRVVGVFGGIDIDKQVRLLRRRTEVVVGTPGRVIDHMERGTIALTRIEFLVIDDIDKMIELGLGRDIRTIVDAIPPRRQTMVFSSVLTKEVSSLAEGILHEPVTVDAMPVETHDIAERQRFLATKPEARIRTLLHLLDSESMQRVCVLSHTDHDAEKISRILRGKGIRSQRMRRSWSDIERERAVAGMKKGTLRVLVGTNDALGMIAAGDVTHVIHYDFPKKDGVELSRKDDSGKSRGGSVETVTFVTEGDRTAIQELEQTIGRRVTITPYPGNNDRHMPSRKPQGTREDGRKNMTPRKVQNGEKQVRPPKRHKKNTIVFGRRKKPVKKMETFSSDHSGAGW